MRENIFLKAIRYFFFREFLIKTQKTKIIKIPLKIWEMEMEIGKQKIKETT